MAGNIYEELVHLCDIYRLVPTGSTDESEDPNEDETLIAQDSPCRMITYPRLAHQETDSIRSVGSLMSRFWLDPTLQPIQVGDRIKNIRDQWGTVIGVPVFYVMRVSPTMTDGVEHIVADASGAVAGMF